jgi:two-component system, OmpR family, sensor histidine kinase PrrB
MRLATRTGLAAFAAAFVTLGLAAVTVRGQFVDIFLDRVDAQLNDRAETAPVLAAISERLARSELGATVAPTQVVVDGELIALGDVPAQGLPRPIAPGWDTTDIDGDRWRTLTIAVDDVPEIGDRTLVQLAEPLGDVDAEVRRLRRRLAFAGIVVSLAAGLTGWLLGRLATRPLTALRRDAGALRTDQPDTWRLSERYGSPEVDDVAGALNASLHRLADATTEREHALAAARAFAASASHELRSPLQSALTNLDIARSDRAAAGMRLEAIELARGQVQRMASSLGAVRALADAEYADPTWFEPIDAGDLADLVEGIVADERRRVPDATIEVIVDMADTDAGPASSMWRHGVQLAVANVVRNALSHGRHPDRPAHVRVNVSGGSIAVDDSGPGVAPADRERLLERFEKGAASAGSGLGLAIAHEVAKAHGGAVAITDSPTGGARVTVTLRP